MLSLEGRTSFNLSCREIQYVYAFSSLPHSLCKSISEVAALLCPLKAIVVVAPYISPCSINKSNMKKNPTKHAAARNVGHIVSSERAASDQHFKKRTQPKLRCTTDRISHSVESREATFVGKCAGN